MERFSPRPWETGPRLAPEGNPPDPWWPTLPIYGLGTAYGLVYPPNMPYEPFPTTWTNSAIGKEEEVKH
uniref:Uncharacterized protein n=1 Tax=Chromera velia CCMP2878 TaxID=1169474 RepID=A0A0G4F4L0_9ALVE|eukprot:Cvel_2724.t1-p1 / transcript=Cvel_2724.t1 / gene=Cvel_2724 / organism=Chromera_velia_CCMP2878 / gene_product=hypothetical protein / transcript_product=hypothetical protein / location=Cvel_scaffold109:38644-38847(+) / protein_length=68 / sequence_SO=supercontig / SO=protein_coding / is_pseudo=false